MSTKTEIESLIYLLEDPDPFVKTTVKNRLFELGEQAVPLLDQQKSQSKNDNERELINEIIQWITFGSLEEDFLDVLEGGIKNLKQLEDAVLSWRVLRTPPSGQKSISANSITLPRWSATI